MFITFLSVLAFLTCRDTLHIRATRSMLIFSFLPNSHTQHIQNAHSPST